MSVENIMVRNVETDKKAKAMFILQAKGKNLSDAVREMVDKLAKEFDETYSK